MEWQPNNNKIKLLLNHISGPIRPVQFNPFMTGLGSIVIDIVKNRRRTWSNNNNNNGSGSINAIYQSNILQQWPGFNIKTSKKKEPKMTHVCFFVVSCFLFLSRNDIVYLYSISYWFLYFCQTLCRCPKTEQKL